MDTQGCWAYLASKVFLSTESVGHGNIGVSFAFFDTRMRADGQELDGKNQDPFNRRLWQHAPFHSPVVRVMIFRNAQNLPH